MVDAGRRAVGLYPVLGGRVLDGAATAVAAGGIDAALASLRWDDAPEGPDDWPWLLAWMSGAKARAAFLAAHAAAPLVVFDIPLLFEKGGWRRVGAKKQQCA